ncbi:MAG TPA: hypothetical protein VEZ13_20490 [Brevibacillus sp.]|nr:hypothetical protein [Brevibacillus sp.]
MDFLKAIPTFFYFLFRLFIKMAMYFWLIVFLGIITAIITSVMVGMFKMPEVLSWVLAGSFVGLTYLGYRLNKK